MAKHILHNGQSASVAASQWKGDQLAFAPNGAAAGASPVVTFTGANTLAGVTDIAAAAAPGGATISLIPGAALIIGGLTVDRATLLFSERPSASVTFNGTSHIGNNSTLTATGYGGQGKYQLNGTMAIDGSSTVNMDYVSVTGNGTFHLYGESALLRVGAVGAGETVTLDGGMLSLANGMSFLGTITDSAPAASRIGPIAAVAVYNTMDAVREVFNQTTGTLDLFNAQGSETAHLKFAGAGTLYAAPTVGMATNYISITSHAYAGSLPVTLTS